MVTSIHPGETSRTDAVVFPQKQTHPAEHAACKEKKSPENDPAGDRHLGLDDGRRHASAIGTGPHNGRAVRRVSGEGVSMWRRRRVTGRAVRGLHLGSLPSTRQPSTGAMGGP